MSDGPFHVMPDGDLIEHELSDGCPCGPSPKLIETERGDRWMISHEALDGRP